LCYDAAKFIIESNYASTAQLQSQFSIGHPRAVRLMKQLEEFKVVGPHEGTKPRKILLGVAELEVIAPRLGRSDDAQQDLSGAWPHESPGCSFIDCGCGIRTVCRAWHRRRSPSRSRLASHDRSVVGKPFDADRVVVHVVRICIRPRARLHRSYRTCVAGSAT